MRATIVGGGIGGLATAIALRQAGWQVTLFEQAPDFRPVGAGIALAPNAVRALDALGLGKRLRERGMAHGAAGLRTSSGRWLMRTRVEELERRFGLPTFALHRADLHQMLVDALDGVEVGTGKTVNGPVDGDVVVAADGLHSRLRGELFPGYPGPSYAGYVTWRGIVPAQVAPPLPHAVTETWGRGSRFGVAPLADGRVYWYATRSGPEGSGRDDSLAVVAARYKDWHDPIPALLAATPPESLLRHDIFSLETPLPSYVSGRTVLLGDAAHAVTPDLGQGAAQALEDAVTLGIVLRAEADVHAALKRYDELRRARTQELVRASARFGRITQWRNPLAVHLRDTLAAALPERVYLNSTAETLGWQPPR